MIKDVVIESALFVVNRQWGKFVCGWLIIDIAIGKINSARTPAQALSVYA